MVFVDSLYMAQGSLTEPKNQIIIAKDLNFIEKDSRLVNM